MRGGCLAPAGTILALRAYGVLVVLTLVGDDDACATALLHRSMDCVTLPVDPAALG
jgi:hypothetical protein